MVKLDQAKTGNTDMSAIGKMTAQTARMGMRYAKRLTVGIDPKRACCFAQAGGESVKANHPAFILGHLCLYPLKVVEHLGGDVSAVTPPAGYEALFSKTAQCQDDPTATLYPPFDEICRFFEMSYDIALDAIQNATDEELLAPNPVDTPMRDLLPTLGSMLSFYLNGHVMTHLGQLSTWRRIEGLPPA